MKKQIVTLLIGMFLFSLVSMLSSCNMSNSNNKEEKTQTQIAQIETELTSQVFTEITTTNEYSTNDISSKISISINPSVMTKNSMNNVTVTIRNKSEEEVTVIHDFDLLKKTETGWVDVVFEYPFYDLLTVISPDDNGTFTYDFSQMLSSDENATYQIVYNVSSQGKSYKVTADFEFTMD